MKTCEEIKNKLAEYYYEELGAEEKAVVGLHLAGCSSCAKELREISSVLKKVSEEKRPVLSGSLYSGIIKKLEQKRAAPKFWNVPFAASAALLVMLAVFSNYQNVSAVKSAELDDAAIVSNIIELANKDVDALSNLDVEILSDELFMEDNLITFGS